VKTRPRQVPKVKSRSKLRKEAFICDGRCETISVGREIVTHRRLGQTYLGEAGRADFGPNARAVSRWGRFVRESARWRANSAAPCSL
jgi:hypothetical protein